MDSGILIDKNQKALREKLFLSKEDGNVIEAVLLSSFVPWIELLPLFIPEKMNTNRLGYWGGGLSIGSGAGSELGLGLGLGVGSKLGSALGSEICLWVGTYQ